MRGRTVARWSIGNVLLLAIGSWPGVAEACRCSGPDVELVRPPWPSNSGLQLISESLEIDCADPNPCRWRSVHVFARSEPGEPARVPMQLPFSEYRALALRWDGEPVELLPQEQRQQAIDWVEEHEGEWYGRHEGVWFWLEDDGQRLTVELEVEGEIFGNASYRSCCHLTALEIRHPFVPRGVAAGVWHWFEPRPAAVASDARTRVRVDADRRLRVEFGRERRNTARRGPARFEQPADPGVAFTVLERDPIAGGPFFAIGGAILDANPARGRIGWEHTFRYPFLFYSAALETDFTSELTFVPAVEITHGGSLVPAFVFPRAGFGVGVPVQFLPDPRPGLRAHVSFSWIVFSVLTTFDWLPELPPTRAGEERPHMLKLAFLGQFSF